MFSLPIKIAPACWNLPATVQSSAGMNVSNIFEPEDEKGIVDHMNNDHSNSLIHYCHLLGMNCINEKDAVYMKEIDQDGLDMEVN